MKDAFTPLLHARLPVRAGTESAVTLSFQTGLAGATAWVVDYKGVSDPMQSGVSSGTTAALVSLTAVPVTTTAPNTQVISLVGANAVTSLSLSTPRSFALQTSLSATNGLNGRSLGIADRAAPVAGSVSPPTWSGGLLSQGAYITVAFRP